MNGEKHIDPKIVDLLNTHTHKPYTSLEFFPPKTPEGIVSLKKKMENFKALKPLFTDITWGAGGSTADTTLDLALTMHNMGHVVNMHLTCTNCTTESIENALKACYEGGIRNIVALRGDPPHGQEKWICSDANLSCALDLVKFIRSRYQDQFCLAVSGYPEGHPNAIKKIDASEVESLTDAEKLRLSKIDDEYYVCRDEDYKKELAYLKSKIDAGANYIITQMFFDANVFIQFVNDCRAEGITCPIVPGVMCISAYRGFKNMTKFCLTRVPDDLAAKMDSIKDDADAVKALGKSFGTEMCIKLIEGGAKGLHFYTLNLEACTNAIVDNCKSILNILPDEEINTAFGNAKAKDTREDGCLIAEMAEWTLAGGQKVTAYLNPSSYNKQIMMG